MTLRYKTKSEEIIELEERLKSLSLAFEIELSADDIPAIVEGKKEHRGIEEMINYIDMLDSEKEAWYYCDC